MENVVAWRLTNHWISCEVLHANAARLLVLFVFARLEGLLGQFVLQVRKLLLFHGFWALGRFLSVLRTQIKSLCLGLSDDVRMLAMCSSHTWPVASQSNLLCCVLALAAWETETWNTETKHCQREKYDHCDEGAINFSPDNFTQEIKLLLFKFCA